MAAGRFIKRGAAPDAPHPSLGTFFAGPRPPGFAAAPTKPGRKLGGSRTPALTGLFQSGKPVAISRINTMATNIHRGQG